MPQYVYIYGFHTFTKRSKHRSQSVNEHRRKQLIKTQESVDEQEQESVDEHMMKQLIKTQESVMNTGGSNDEGREDQHSKEP